MIDKDSVLTILSLVIANTTLLLIGHSRHDKLSENTYEAAKELMAATQHGGTAFAANLDKQMDSLFSRYKAALLAFICFGIQELALLGGFFYYLTPPLWLASLFLPVLGGLGVHVCLDLCPAARATRLRVEAARDRYKTHFSQPSNPVRV